MDTKKTSMRNQIILYSSIVSSIVLIFGLLIIFLIYRYTQYDMNKHMEAVLVSTRDEISDLIELPLQLFEHVDAFIDKGYQIESMEVSNYLSTIQESYDYFTDIHLVGYNGVVLNTNAKDRTIIGTSVIYEPYFQNEVRLGREMWSKVYISEDNKPSISVTIPKTDYQIIVDIDLDQLRSRISRKGIMNELISLDVVDQFGTFIVSDDMMKVERRYQYEGFGEIKTLLLGVDQYFQADERVGYVYLQQLNGYVILKFDQNNLYSSIGKMTAIFLALWIFFCLLIIRAIYSYLGMVGKDLSILQLKTDKLQKGDYTNHEEKTLKFEEFIDLSNKFSVMAKTVELREHEIKSINESLENRIHERTVELQDLNGLLEEEIQEKERYENELQLINMNLDSEVSRRTKELEFLNLELKRSTEKAIEANEAKSKFLSIMSHEMRTPLNGIIGFVQMLEDENLNEEQKEIFKLIQNSSTILVSLINDLLDLSKYESKKMMFEVVPFNLDKVIQSCIVTFIPIGEAKKIKVKSDIRFDSNRSVYGDPTKITQLIFNLLSNAVKFTHQGYVELRAYTSILNGILTLKLEVEDTGIGIKEEYKDNLFKPFSQGDLSISKRFGGSGLGLIICKEIVQHYNGSIEYESEYAKGTKFSVQLEFKVASEKVTNNIEIIDKKMVRDSVVTKVLVAEDNEINQKVMKKYLTKNNIDFDVAINGREAVELATANKYDLICMDCQMPEMDGYEATKIIRESGILVPIIAMTAFTSMEDKNQCFEAGMNGFLSKPIDFRELANYLGLLGNEDKNNEREKEKEEVINNDSNIVNVNDKQTLSDRNSEYDKHTLRLMEKIDFDYETCLDLIITFESQCNIFFKDMDEYIKNNDYPALARKLHQFKGAAGALRFDTLVNYIVNAENCLKDDKNEMAIQIIRKMEQRGIFEE